MSEAAQRVFIVVLRPGPLWEPGKISRDQPFWVQHSAFLTKLFNLNRLLISGSYADGSGVHLLMSARNESEIRDWLQVDPFVLNGVCVMASVSEWLIHLNKYG